MRPIEVIPWENDFPAALLDILVAETGGDFRDVLVVFPHRRPRRYLLERIKGDGRIPKPCMPPEMRSAGELFRRLRLEMDESPPAEAPILDRVALLQECVASLKDEGGPAALPVGDHGEFFPWGVRLAGLLEDLLRQGLEPGDLRLPEGDLEPFALALLGRLGDIFRGYREALDSHGLTTPGLDAWWCARRVEAVVEHLGGKRLYLAGIHAPAGAEETVYRALWEAGATVLVQGDATLVRGGARGGAGGGYPHWACGELENLFKRWGAPTRLWGTPDESRGRSVVFHEGFDLHSQLDALGRELAEAPELDEAAVVLPDESMLMPVLHHLPVKEVNISMGYPLERSNLARLLETVLHLQETAADSGEGGERYYWRDVIDLIRHPYLKMLFVGEARPLRLLFHAMEDTVRQGRKYVDPLAWRPSTPDVYGETDSEEADALLEEVLSVCLRGFENCTTLAELANGVEALCSLLLSHGGDLWRRFPLDAEGVFRMRHEVIPALRHGLMSGTPYPPATLFAVLRGLLRAERVPFEAEPLLGLQVMGMLETRLLRFDTVFLAGATEDLLPGGPPHDPLLPDSLRGVLGLSDGRQRDLVAAYNFHRLLKGARRAVVLYQCGVESGGILEHKSVRSRFVEELVWKVERERGHMLESGEPPLHSVSYPVRPIPERERLAVTKTETVQRRLEHLLGTGSVSPSLLDTYLQCPVRFFYRYLTPLRSVEEVEEEGDPAAFGELTHNVLRDFLAPWVGKSLLAGGDSNALDSSASASNGLAPEVLLTMFSTRLAESDFFPRMPRDARLLLDRAGRERLYRFLTHMPATTILALEESVEAEVKVEGRTYLLRGRLDRLDVREEGVVILDYKTGSVVRPRSGIWLEEEFWSRLAGWRQGEDSEALSDLADGVRSVQLACYLYMYRNAGKAMPHDAMPHEAAWVELKKEGREIPLLGESLSPEEREVVLQERIPILLEFLFRHMLHCDQFQPHEEERRCSWCEYRGVCGE
jgi:ATP-dependent helicase/nuclease subunit B